MKQRKVRIILDEGVQLPSYETICSVGADLRSHSDKVICVRPGSTATIPTGIRIDLDDDCEVQIRPRSGLAAKFGIQVLNSPGTIDPDYQGEIAVILHNTGKEKFLVKKGDRIAQMVLVENIVQADWEQCTEFRKKTDRGEGGLGHTGK